MGNVPRARGVPHHAAARDGAELREELAQLGVIHGVLQVLDVQVRARHLLHAFAALGVELVLQLGFPLRFLLRPAHDPGFVVVHFVVPVKVIHRFDRGFGIFEAHKPEALGFAFPVLHHHDAGQGAAGFENLPELFFRYVLVQVLDVHVVEHRGPAAALAPALERPDVHLLVIHQHAVHLGDGAVRGFRGVELHETVPLALRV